MLLIVNLMAAPNAKTNNNDFTYYTFHDDYQDISSYVNFLYEKLPEQSIQNKTISVVVRIVLTKIQHSRN